MTPKQIISILQDQIGAVEQESIALKSTNEALVNALKTAHAPLYDLLKAYAVVQEHHGLQPEASQIYVAAQEANKCIVAALKQAGAE